MKKLGIVVIALALFVVGMAMADPGAIAVNEVQGLSVSTTVIGAGNFNQASSVVLTTMNSDGENDLGDIPNVNDFTYYTTVYTEDTQNSEYGYISYDKDLDVSTGNKLLGQYNVQAVKQITYLGIDASSILTTDYMMLDGAGADYGTVAGLMICPFGSPSDAPAFCNVVETGSSANLKVANMNTQMGERFITKTSDPGVQIYNNVAVGSYAADVPSKGSVSAFIQGSIKEGGQDGTGRRNGIDAGDLAETMTFKDSTSFAGDITSFAKSMSYTSKLG
ncbi:MAG: hypothetical protein GKC06_01850 [Methanomicrobiales archaeon]|nr:hypothetical protein [Methanomicrobiales archaeon]